tara:strand:- start:818 stop:1216 length:399 start_codon:yes stop_codon:yes gene_type:complete
MKYTKYNTPIEAHDNVFREKARIDNLNRIASELFPQENSQLRTSFIGLNTEQVEAVHTVSGYRLHRVIERGLELMERWDQTYRLANDWRVYPMDVYAVVGKYLDSHAEIMHDTDKRAAWDFLESVKAQNLTI